MKKHSQGHAIKPMNKLSKTIIGWPRKAPARESVRSSRPSFILTAIALAFASLAIGASTANGTPGDLFVSDPSTNTIYKFAPDGTRSTFATGLNAPLGLAFDGEGNLFEADNVSGTIYKFAPDGTPSTFATGLNEPTGLACDSAGNLFVSDTPNGTIYKFAPDGTRSTFATGLYGPYGLAVDSASNLFVADASGRTIYKFAPDGTQSTFATWLNLPAGLAFDSAGNLFASDFYFGTIYKFAPDGTRSTFATGLISPLGLACDSADNLFEADAYSGTIYKFAPDGARSTFATGLADPFFLAIQPARTLSYAAQIQPPINADGTSIFSIRRGVVPVRFTLTQGGVATCDLPPATIAVTRTGGGVIGQVNESVYSGNADTGSNFRIDSCQYVYNLNSSALGVGTYRVDILVNGQVVGSAVCQLQ
jgi:sugar lactone lactonase YvrE